VLVLEEEYGRHPNDEQMEQYALGGLAQEAIPAFEQHLLICHTCQDRVAFMDASVEAMQAEARQIRVEEMQGKANGTSIS
jgi:anti-sigma factor ChrR (cupin superfamily)